MMSVSVLSFVEKVSGMGVCDGMGVVVQDKPMVDRRQGSWEERIIVRGFDVGRN